MSVIRGVVGRLEDASYFAALLAGVWLGGAAFGTQPLVGDPPLAAEARSSTEEARYSTDRLDQELQDEDEAVVHTLMFYSPACGHCHSIITTMLPELEERYGDQLEVLIINADSDDGAVLFRSALDWREVPNELRGVPALFIGEKMLLGEEINEQLVSEIESHLAAGGVDWPAIPGLAASLSEVGVQTGEARTFGDLSIRERLAIDPAGNTFALITLVAMIATVLVVAASWLRGGGIPDPTTGWRAWAVPALVVVGLIVAVYLAYVETTETLAICGPVGDCNTVQQSEYATLFGVLPIGVLGVLGYLTIVALWAWQKVGPRAFTSRTRWLLPAAALFGLVFSIYLTFLEPFVIGAVCMWCVTSAVVMMVLTWVTAHEGHGIAAFVATRRAVRVKRAPAMAPPTPAAAGGDPPSSAEAERAPTETSRTRRLLRGALIAVSYAAAVVVGLLVATAVVHVYKSQPPPTVMSVETANRRAALESAMLVGGLVVGPVVWHLIRVWWRSRKA